MLLVCCWMIQLDSRSRYGKVWPGNCPAILAGDMGDTFFMIYEGQALLVVRDDQGEDMILGAIFGCHTTGQRSPPNWTGRSIPVAFLVLVITLEVGLVGAEHQHPHSLHISSRILIESYCLLISIDIYWYMAKILWKDISDISGTSEVAPNIDIHGIHSFSLGCLSVIGRAIVTEQRQGWWRNTRILDVLQWFSQWFFNIVSTNLDSIYIYIYVWTLVSIVKFNFSMIFRYFYIETIWNDEICLVSMKFL